MPQTTLKPCFTTYPETLAFLKHLDYAVMKLGTERMAAVLHTLGNPQDRFKSIHVVGTNGKGSTCATLNSMYTAQGYNTGLFTSPHLVDVRERIQLNSHLVTESDFIASAQAIQEAITRTFPEGGKSLTYFEFLNAMAFWLFAQKQVNIAIIEAGLGGRLDSTNTLSAPALIIVTPISLDHTDRLGNTLEAITSEKSGVFKPHCPVISAPQTPEARDTLSHHARQTQSSLTWATGTAISLGCLTTENGQLYRQLSHPNFDEPLQTNLIGRYQAVNLGVALEAIEALQALLPVSAENIRAGLKTIHWPGRFQYFPAQNLIIDGSHNEQGIQSLLETLAFDFSNVKIHFGVSLLANRDPRLFLPLAEYTQTASVTPILTSEPQRFHPPSLFNESLNFPLAVPETLGTFLQRTRNSRELRVLTGSLYTAGAALGAGLHLRLP